MRALSVFLTLATTLGLPGAALAASLLVDINAGNFASCFGQNRCTIGTTELQAQGHRPNATSAGLATFGGPPTFAQSMAGALQGLGVRFVNSGGATGNEIQFSEAISMQFGTVGIIETLQLVFLLNAQQSATGVAETAVIASDPNGNQTVYRLRALGTGPGDFLWTGQGSVTLEDPNTGLWSITRPFGDDAVTTLRLASPTQPPTNRGRTDYAFHALRVVSVPEPASLALLGMGLFGLVAARRARRTQATA